MPCILIINILPMSNAPRRNTYFFIIMVLNNSGKNTRTKKSTFFLSKTVSNVLSKIIQKVYWINRRFSVERMFSIKWERSIDCRKAFIRGMKEVLLFTNRWQYIGNIKSSNFVAFTNKLQFNTKANKRCRHNDCFFYSLHRVVQLILTW